MADSVHLAAGDGDEDFRQGRASSDAAPSAHTPGEWAVHRASDRDRAWIVPIGHVARHIGGSSDMKADRDEYAQQICTLAEDIHGRRSVMDEARRIVRCVNVHDELVAALQLLVSAYDPEDNFAELEVARAAIAKALGTPDSASGSPASQGQSQVNKETP